MAAERVIKAQEAQAHPQTAAHAEENSAENLRRRLRSLDNQVKKLHCLYRVSALVNDYTISMEETMRRIVELIPAAYQYPDAARARIRCADSVFESDGFIETPWRQTGVIGTQRERFGSVEVCYREQKPEEDEGSFLREERELIDTIGELLGTVIERKNTREELRLFKERMHLILRNLPNVLWAVDREGIYTMMEGTGLSDLGLRPGELVGKPIWNLALNRPDIEESLRSAFHGEEVVAEIEFRDRILDVRHVPIIDADGSLIGVLGTAVDVTERVKVERELRETNELLEKVFASTNFQIAQLSADFNFIRVNGAFAQADCHEPDFFVGKNYFTVYPTSKNKEIFERVLRTGEPYTEREQPFVFPEHPERGLTYWDWDLFRVEERPQAGKSLVLTLVDRTSHRKAVIELEKSRAELRDLASHLQDLRENERKRISREVHDELGALLTALKMDVSLLGPGVLKSTKKKTETFASALGLSDKAISMVQRITSDLRPRLLDDFGLLPALEWLLEDFRKHTHIKAEINSGFREVMDKEQATVLFRIAQEALSNVARHSKATEVTLQLYTSPGWLLFSVQDNGIGVPENRLSDPSSFGLIGMRERAVALGGEVEIKNLPKKGAAVTVRIPLIERQETE